MSVPEDVILSWLQRARSDLQLGRVALLGKGLMFEDVCFHAQQSTGKPLPDPN